MPDLVALLLVVLAAVVAIAAVWIFELKYRLWIYAQLNRMLNERIEPTGSFVIETRSDGQSIRLEGTTSEAVMALYEACSASADRSVAAERGPDVPDPDRGVDVAELERREGAGEVRVGQFPNDRAQQTGPDQHH